MSETTDMRREFEWLAKTHDRDLTPDDSDEGFYKSSRTDSAWIFWQAATERATASQWQPIETAPEQQVVLVAVVGAGVTTGFHIKGLGWHWDELDDEPADSSVSHWMPLPPPPAIRQGGDK